jgi:hypothetical protein
MVVIVKQLAGTLTRNGEVIPTVVTPKTMLAPTPQSVREVLGCDGLMREDPLVLRTSGM